MSLELIRKIIREELGRNKQTKFSPDSPAGIITMAKIVADYVTIDTTSNTTDGRTNLSIVCKDHLSDEIKKQIKILPVNKPFNSYNEVGPYKNNILRIVQQQINSKND